MFYIGKDFNVVRNLRKKTVKKILENRKFKVLVDVGCGDGAITNTLAQYADEAWGIDKYYKPVPCEKFRFSKVENDSYPFASSSVDCTTLLEVVEHQKDPRPIICEVYRILKPGGILILSTPNLRSLQRELYLSALYHRRRGKYPKFPINLGWDERAEYGSNTHFKEYAVKEIRDILVKQGFKIRKVTGTLFGFLFYWKKYIIFIGSELLAKLFPNLSVGFFIMAEK